MTRRYKSRPAVIFQETDEYVYIHFPDGFTMRVKGDKTVKLFDQDCEEVSDT